MSESWALQGAFTTCGLHIYVSQLNEWCVCGANEWRSCVKDGLFVNDEPNNDADCQGQRREEGHQAGEKSKTRPSPMEIEHTYPHQ